MCCVRTSIKSELWVVLHFNFLVGIGQLGDKIFFDSVYDGSYSCISDVAHLRYQLGNPTNLGFKVKNWLKHEKLLFLKYNPT